MSASPGASHPLVAAWLATTRRRGGPATSGALAWEAALDGTRAFRPGPGGLALTCRHGTFLVTQEGDLEDHVLETGGTFATGSPGLVVAWALRAGVLVARAGGAHQPRP